MVINQTAHNKKPLNRGEKFFVFIVGLASAPGYLAALILLPGYILESIVGRHYHSGFYDRLVDVLSGGRVAHPFHFQRSL